MTTPLEHTRTQHSEVVTIPTSEGESANTHSTPPPILSTSLRTSVRKIIQTLQNPTPSEVSHPTRKIPNYITQEAMKSISIPTQLSPTPLKHFCAPVIHPITVESITDHEKLADNPETREVWTTASGTEWVNLAQVDRRTGTKEKNSLFVLDHIEIKKTPTNRAVTYTNIVLYYRPQKTDPNRVRITSDGNIMDHPG